MWHLTRFPQPYYWSWSHSLIPLYATVYNVITWPLHISMYIKPPYHEDNNPTDCGVARRTNSSTDLWAFWWTSSWKCIRASRSWCSRSWSILSKVVPSPDRKRHQTSHDTKPVWQLSVAREKSRKTVMRLEPMWPPFWQHTSFYCKKNCRLNTSPRRPHRVALNF